METEKIKSELSTLRKNLMGLGDEIAKLRREIKLYKDKDSIIIYRYCIKEEQSKLYNYAHEIHDLKVELNKNNKLIEEQRQRKVKKEKKLKVSDIRKQIAPVINYIIFENGEINNYGSDALIKLYKDIYYFGKKDKEIYLSKIINYLINLCENKTTNEVTLIFNQIRQINKTASVFIKDKKDRKFYKEINRMLKKYKVVSLEPKEKNNSMIQIFDELLTQRKYVPFIKRLLNKKNYTFDIYNMYDSYNNHYFVKLIRKLIESMKLELSYAKEDYLPKEYIIEVIKEFNNSNLKLSSEDILKIKEILDESKNEFASKRSKKSEDMYMILDKLFDIKKTNQSATKNVEWFMFEPKENIEEKSSGDYIISFNNDKLYNNIAYSIKRLDNGNYVLKVHVRDVTNMFMMDTPIYDVLKNEVDNTVLLSNHKEYLNRASFNKKELKNALTYEFEINNKPQVVRYEVYQNKIKINDYINFKEDDTLDTKSNRRFFIFEQLYTILHSDKVHRIDRVFNHFVSKFITYRFQNLNLPMIYKGQEKLDTKLRKKIMSNINSYTKKLDKHDANIVVGTIEEETNVAYYSQKAIQNFTSQDRYVDILGPVNNFIRLTIQQITKDTLVKKNERINFFEDVYAPESEFKDVSYETRKVVEEKHKDTIKEIIKHMDEAEGITAYVRNNTRKKS